MSTANLGATVRYKKGNGYDIGQIIGVYGNGTYRITDNFYCSADGAISTVAWKDAHVIKQVHGFTDLLEIGCPHRPGFERLPYILRVGTAQEFSSGPEEIVACEMPVDTYLIQGVIQSLYYPYFKYILYSPPRAWLCTNMMPRSGG